MIKKPFWPVAALAAATFTCAPFAFAQDLAVQAAVQSIVAQKGFAASGFQVPIAAGGSLGSVGVGAYGQTTDARDGGDGSLGLNVGLGDPVKYAGLDAAMSLTSLLGDQGSPDSFGEAGSFALKLHKNLPGYMSVAAGVQTIGRWGVTRRVNKSSRYGSVSKFFFAGDHGLGLTLGLGDRAFNDSSGVGAFGAVAFYVTSAISVIAERTGKFDNLAISVAPIRTMPLSLSVGAVNLNDDAGLGTQFAASVGYGFAFKK